MANNGLPPIGLIKALGQPSPEAIASSVDAWLDDHPEATTTVEDGAITKAKLDSSLQSTVDDVGDLKIQIIQVQNGIKVLFSTSTSFNSSTRGIDALTSGRSYVLEITPTSDIGNSEVLVGSAVNSGRDQSLGTFNLQNGVTTAISFTANGAWERIRVPSNAYNVSAAIYDYNVTAYFNGEISDINDDITAIDGQIESIEGEIDDLEAASAQVDASVTAIRKSYYKKVEHVIENTESATFVDNEGNNAISALVVTIEPSQSGTGTPSFSNIRPISGTNAVTYVNGEDSEIIAFVDGSNNSVTVYSGSVDLVTGVATITAVLQTFTGSDINAYDSSGNVPFVKVNTSRGFKRYTDIDIISNALVFSTSSQVDGTIYIRSWTSQKFELYSSSFTSQANAASIMNSTPVQILYPVEPFTIQLDPTELKTVRGDNTISVSTGEFDISYYIDFQSAVAEVVEKTNPNAGDGGYGLSSDALLYIDQVPTYYSEPEATPATYDEAYSYLEDKIGTIPAGRSFVFITDTHWAGNQKHSTQLINYIRKRTGIRNVLFGGDILGNSATSYGFVKTGGNYLMQSRQAFGRDYIPCVGDHDGNSNIQSGDTIEAQFVPYAEVARMFVGDLKNRAHFYQPTEKLAQFATGTNYNECLAFFKTVYYVDDDLNHFRFIVMNNGYNAPQYGAVYNVFGGAGSEVLRLQFDWLAETLMSTPEKYDIIVLGHKINQQSSSGNVVEGMLSSFARKLTTFYPHPASAGGIAIDQWWPNTTTYSFSDAPDVGRILQMNGHTHKDSQSWFGLDDTDTYQKGVAYDGIKILNQRTKGQIPTTNTQTDAAANVDSPEAAPMTVGTVTEQCFDVVTFNDDGIFFTRFGAGSDRHFYME